MQHSANLSEDHWSTQFIIYHDSVTLSITGLLASSTQKADVGVLIHCSAFECLFMNVHIHFQLISHRIHAGALRGPWDASVRQEKRLQFWRRGHFVFFLQYGVSPRGGTRVGLSGRRAENVERPTTKMCWYVITLLLIALKKC